MNSLQKIRTLASIDQKSLLYEGVGEIYKSVSNIAPSFVKFLSKTLRRRNVAMMRPATKAGPHGLRVQFSVGNKRPGEFVPEHYYMLITYQPSSDSCLVETGHVDGWNNTKWRETFSEVKLSQLNQPKRFFARATSDAKQPKPKLTGEEKEIYAQEIIEGALRSVDSPVSIINEEETVDSVCVDDHFLRLAGIRPTEHFFTADTANFDPIDEAKGQLTEHMRVLAGLSKSFGIDPPKSRQ